MSSALAAVCTVDCAIEIVLITLHYITLHDATQYTPYFLMMGREVRAPVDIFYGSPDASQPGSYDSYADGMQ